MNHENSKTHKYIAHKKSTNLSYLLNMNQNYSAIKIFITMLYNKYIISLENTSHSVVHVRKLVS